MDKNVKDEGMDSAQLDIKFIVIYLCIYWYIHVHVQCWNYLLCSVDMCINIIMYMYMYMYIHGHVMGADNPMLSTIC